MAKEPTPGPGGAFDLRRIKRLVELMDEHGLSEVDLCEGDTRVRLRRPEAAPPLPFFPPAATYGGGPAPSPNPQVAPETKQPPGKELLEIKSPMVGTFYRASAPDADPYVQIGSHVEPETTVCIIEAMKVFNEIPAECRGRIAEILVESGAPVEYGQVLFRVDPA